MVMVVSLHGIPSVLLVHDDSPRSLAVLNHVLMPSCVEVNVALGGNVGRCLRFGPRYSRFFLDCGHVA